MQIETFVFVSLFSLVLLVFGEHRRHRTIGGMGALFLIMLGLWVLVDPLGLQLYSGNVTVNPVHASYLTGVTDGTNYSENTTFPDYNVSVTQNYSTINWALTSTFTFSQVLGLAVMLIGIYFLAYAAVIHPYEK